MHFNFFKHKNTQFVTFIAITYSYIIYLKPYYQILNIQFIPICLKMSYFRNKTIVV